MTEPSPLTIYPAIARRRAGGDEFPAEFVAMIQAIKDITKKLYDARVPLLAGTDTTDLTESFELEPGAALHNELAMLETAGIPAAALIQMASLNAARFVGKESETGSIAAGMAADFVLLDSDPASGAAAFADIDAVYRGGQRVFARSDP